jgi:hypothetical protein
MWKEDPNSVHKSWQGIHRFILFSNGPCSRQGHRTRQFSSRTWKRMRPPAPQTPSPRRSGSNIHKITNKNSPEPRRATPSDNTILRSGALAPALDHVDPIEAAAVDHMKVRPVRRRARAGGRASPTAGCCGGILRLSPRPRRHAARGSAIPARPPSIQPAPQPCLRRRLPPHRPLFLRLLARA